MKSWLPEYSSLLGHYQHPILFSSGYILGMVPLYFYLFYSCKGITSPYKPFSTKEGLVFSVLHSRSTDLSRWAKPQSCELKEELQLKG